MNYGELLSRTWHLVWKTKFLILLGILVALGSTGGTASASNGSRTLPQFDQTWHLPMLPEWRGSVPGVQEWGLPSISLAVALVLVGIALAIGLTVWVVSTLSRGALIAGAKAVDSGSVSNLAAAFATAWRKGWTLLGIGIFPVIPTLVLLLGSLGAAAIFIGMPPVIGGVDQAAGPRNAWLILGALTCIALPFVFVLDLLRVFANRACMLEGSGVIAAYGRGFRVLVDNIGSALLLFLIQVGIGLATSLVLLLPALCCLLWPVLLLVRGMAVAYFSTMWTLAWRQWVDMTPTADEATAA